MPPKERVSLVKTPLPGPKSKLLIQKESRTMAAGAYGDPVDRRFMAIKA